MGKFLIWAVASFFLILTVTTINIQGNQTIFASDYAENLSRSHHGDHPVATPLVAQDPKMPALFRRDLSVNI